MNFGAEAIYRYFYLRRKAKFERAAEARDDIAARDYRVISVGNLTTGGTGKTPTVQWIARRLADQGVSVAVVARGYRGKLSQEGAVVSDGRTVFLDAGEAGDEPVAHAIELEGIPVVIGRDRCAAVARAVREFDAQVIVLDDAYQYWSLPRDLDLVLMDARRPFDNGHLLPSGQLREPPEELRRADAIVLTRADMATEVELAAARTEISKYSGASILCCSHQPTGLRELGTRQLKKNIDFLQGMPVGLLSALRDNDAFANSVTRRGVEVVGHLQRHDHHRWRKAEVNSFMWKARERGATILITTSKDAVKLDPDWSPELTIWSLRMEIDFGSDEPRIAGLIDSVVKLRGD